MLRIIFILAVATTLFGCGLDTVESDTGTEPGPSPQPDEPAPDRIPADDPAIDERLDDLEIVCETTLTMSGTVANDPARPADAEGCWELGTWTVTATVDRVGCDPQPALEASYTYNVYLDEDEARIIDFAADPEVRRVQFNINSNGGGTCNATFEHFGTNDVWDGWVLSLKPVFHQDGTVDGKGTLSYYAFDPF